MRVRISEPELLPELVAFLRTHTDLVVEQSDEDEIDAGLIGSYNEEAQRMAIELLVLAWQASRPGVEYEFLREADLG